MDNLFENICSVLKLGSLINEVENITGGLTNKIYKLSTNKGKYAIKVINKNNILKDKTLLDKIELSEEIANLAYRNNINAIAAIKFNGKYIQNIDDNYFLVFKWNNGKVLLTKELTTNHIEKIAKMQAKLHNIKIVHNIGINKYERINYKKYYDLLKNNNDEWCIYFKENINVLCNYYDKVYDSYLKLSNQKSYVHKDLNRKNILWKEDTPYIIDFETATIGNPSIDFFNSVWFLSNDIEPVKFNVYCKEYFKHFKLKDDFNISIYAAIIEECMWLEFSLKRALGICGEDEILIGKESVSSSLKQILDYYNKIPLMIELINKL